MAVHVVYFVDEDWDVVREGIEGQRAVVPFPDELQAEDGVTYWQVLPLEKGEGNGEV